MKFSVNPALVLKSRLNVGMFYLLRQLVEHHVFWCKIAELLRLRPPTVIIQDPPAALRRPLQVAIRLQGPYNPKPFP